MTEILALIGVLSALAGGVAGFITATSAARKAASDVRKAGAESDNLAVDTASDAVSMIRSVYDERIVRLEEQVTELARMRAADRQEIIALTRKLGTVMRSAEKQSDVILALRDEVCLWKERVEELLRLLRQHSISLPSWAGAAK